MQGFRVDFNVLPDLPSLLIVLFLQITVVCVLLVACANIAGLLLIWLLFGRLISTLKWALCIIINALFISIGFIIFNKDLNWYVGLSGVLHGMFVCGAIASLVQGYRAEALLLILLIGKLIWEQLQGALPGSAVFAGGDVVVDAHLYGAIIGAVSAAFLVSKQTPPAETAG